MKKIVVLLSIFIFTACPKAFAQNYTIEEAVDILVPYEADHIMTREECATALLKATGVNDDCLITESYLRSFDTEMIEDVDYYSFRGRNIYFANTFLGEKSIPTIKDFYGTSLRFYSDYTASGASVVSWMLGVLQTNTEYTGENNLLECALEAKLLDESEKNILNIKLSTNKFKLLLKRFLGCTVYSYVSYRDGEYPTTTVNPKYISNDRYTYENPDLRYIDIFNQTYKGKNIYIKNDGIYLEKNRIEYDGKQPFVDENGVMMMPVKWFADMVGFENVSYEEETGYARLTDYKWLKDTYRIDVCLAFQNGLSKYGFLNSDINAYDFGTPAKIINGCMYVPMRPICESLMYNVVWDIE